MQNRIETDYLIIGQGIAGTLFAHELEKHGHSFVVIDPNKHNASKTAAGMYNPAVLKRFSAVWQAREQIATAKKTIAELESILQIHVDYPMDILRVFHDESEKHTWTKKAASDDLQGLLETQFINNISQHIAAPYGLGKVNLGGKVDLKTLLDSYRKYLESHQKIYTETIDYQRLRHDDSGTSQSQYVYQGKTVTVTASKVVCCEGYGIKENPYFSHLPLKGNKGEILLIKAPGLNLAAAVKSKVFIMPMTELGHDVYFVGATYNWTDKDTQPTESAKQEMLAKLSQFVSSEISILSHHAGIRPTVADRRPLLGQHAKQPHLYIFNGLGTRGVMLGATMTKHLYALTEKGKKLPAEIDISRFSI